MKKRILSILLTLCMVLCLVPTAIQAEGGNTNITEINFKGLSNELWSYKDLTFATVDGDAGYTIKEQVWNASNETSIRPDSANLKPKAGTEYTFVITLEAKDGYVFPIKSESAVFYNGTIRLDGTEYDGGVATVSSGGKTLKAILFLLTKAKGVTLQEANIGTEDELTAALQDDTVGNIKLADNIELSNDLKIENRSDLILDLNGYVLSLKNGVNGSIFSAIHNPTSNQTIKLTIMDSTPDAEHKFTPNDKGLWVWDETGGTETVSGGVITGGNGEGGSGGDMTIGQNATVVMEGGNIVGCKTGYAGGGVYVNDGTFTMTAGTIQNCKSENDGGGVYVAKNGTFTMTGGSIADCTGTNGSALYLIGGTMNANGGTVSGTVVLNTNNNGGKGIIQGSGSNATQFNGDVTNYGEIKHGTFSGTVTLGNSTLSGTISGGIFNGPVTTASEGNAEISGGIFNKTVTINQGRITNGTFNKDVVVGNVQVSFSCTTLTGGTYNGLIINKSTYAAFAGAHSPLGIIEEKPSYNPGTYYKVTFDPAGGNMDYQERYFFYNGNISDQIAPDFRAGYFFAGWYNGENKWNHSDIVGEDDLTLTAHWTACDHSGHTGAQPTCTDTVICTVCNGTIPALGHDWGEWTSDNNNTHTRICKRDNTHTQTKDCSGGEATCREKAVCADCGKALRRS